MKYILMIIALIFAAQSPTLAAERNLMNNPKNNVPTANLEPWADLQDDGENYIVKSEMPGIEKDKINIGILEGALLVTGSYDNLLENTVKATGYSSKEHRYGSFSKSLTLPGPVDETRIFANYENGVLTVKLPKLEKQEINLRNNGA